MSNPNSIKITNVPAQSIGIHNMPTLIRGEKGLDGYTPHRGVDYWTAEDRAPIEAATANANAAAASVNEAKTNANTAATAANTAAENANTATASANTAAQSAKAAAASASSAAQTAETAAATANSAAQTAGTAAENASNAAAAANTAAASANVISNSLPVVTEKDICFAVNLMFEDGNPNFYSSVVNRICNYVNPVYVISGTVSCTTLCKYRVLYYTKPVASALNFVKISDWMTNTSYTIDPGYYVVILAGFSDNHNIAFSEEVSDNISISIRTSYSNDHNLITSHIKSWSQGGFSPSTGDYEASNYNIKCFAYIKTSVNAIFCDAPLNFRVCAYDTKSGGFIGVLNSNGNFQINPSITAEYRYVNFLELRQKFPDYKFRIYAFKSNTITTPEESEHIYYIEDECAKTLSNERFSGKVVAVIGDSISTNGNTGIDCNVPEIVIQSADVGVSLSAFLTYYDVAAGLTIGGHTFTSEEIGTEVTFTPASSDVGKVIGLPNNYNENQVTTWWEVLQSELGVNCIPNTWSGASVTSHEASSAVRKCSHAWHDSQIRKCGVRVPGTMTRTAPDIIIIYRGTNDFSHAPYTVLTDNYFDGNNWEYPDTDVVNGNYGFLEGLALTVKKLRSAYPNAQIFLCTLNVFKRIIYDKFPTRNGINTLPEYNNAIRQAADFFGCGLIEFDKDGITFENLYSGGYVTDSSSIPTHPNDKGHAVMGRRAISDLRNQYTELS